MNGRHYTCASRPTAPRRTASGDWSSPSSTAWAPPSPGGPGRGGLTPGTASHTKSGGCKAASPAFALDLCFGVLQEADDVLVTALFLAWYRSLSAPGRAPRRRLPTWNRSTPTLQVRRWSSQTTLWPGRRSAPGPPPAPPGGWGRTPAGQTRRHPPADEAVLPENFLQDLGGLLEGPVPLGVAVAVVDLLEAVQVHHDEIPQQAGVLHGLQGPAAGVKKAGRHHPGNGVQLGLVGAVGGVLPVQQQQEHHEDEQRGDAQQELDLQVEHVVVPGVTLDRVLSRCGW